MPRRPRLIVPGVPQHLIVRGVNRAPIFAEASDYHFYLDKLRDACRKYDLAIHAYVLMTNHVHLLARPRFQSSLAKVMQSVGRYYVQYFNYKYQRTGTLWEGRYKSSLLDSEYYFLVCSRYIELNPVRANMVASPKDYPWSSYGCNALGDNNLLITHSDEYLALGSDNAAREEVYRDLFKHHVDNELIDNIRGATGKGWVIGNDVFKEKIKMLSNQQVEPKKRGGDRKSKKFRLFNEIN